MPSKPQSRRVADRWLFGTTTSLPSSFGKDEIGLMTSSAFLDYRNPQGKHHPSEAYDFDLEKMNQDFGIHHVGSYPTRSHGDLSVYQKGKKDFLIRSGETGELLAVIHDGTAYHSPCLAEYDVPAYYFPSLGKDSETLPVRQTRKVKYIHEYAPLVSDAAKRNLGRYPTVLQRIKAGDEFLEVRAEKQPEENAGDTIAILNSSGQIVAEASNEWGATLLAVAREYRGRSLGKKLGQVWYAYNPRFPSGGMTPAGKANALAIWEARVREFLARGWYSELLRQGRLTKKQLDAILAGLKERPKDLKPPEPVKAQSPLFMIDPGSYFFIYDRAFFEEQDDRFLYGFGFFRSSGDKTFLYRIDYDRKYHKLATLVALQMARDAGYDLYVGPGYADVLELEGVPHVEVVGDHAHLTKDVLDLRPLKSLESRYRKSKDPYGEIKTLVMEMSESKTWGS